MEQAEADARAITDPMDQTRALESLAKMLADAGDLRRAEALARMIPLPVLQADSLAAIAEAAASAGNLEQAKALAQSAEQIARTATSLIFSHNGLIPDPYGEGANALRALTRVAAGSGQLGLAEVLARTISDPAEHIQALETIAEAAVAAGDLNRARLMAEEAERIVGTFTHARDREDARRALVRVMTVAGNLERARVLAQSLTDPEWQANMLAYVAEAAAATGELAQARVMADAVERIAATSS
jgi:hypothetical protein